jgi:sporulation protein YlmC with PRC-barrel domain
MTGSESVALARTAASRRSQILGTQVISQNSAARLGIINQLWVDLERRQVLLLSVQKQVFAATSLMMELAQVAALGPDAILIPNEEVFDDFELEGLSRIVGNEVVTEGGVRLGKVKDFLFDRLSGFVSTLVISNLGIPLLPGYVDSTYQLNTREVVGAGDRRIIVADGAETRLEIEQVSLLKQWFNLGGAPWETQAPSLALPRAGQGIQDEEDYEDEYEEDYEEDEGKTPRKTATKAPLEEEDEEPTPVEMPVVETNSAWEEEKTS